MRQGLAVPRRETMKKSILGLSLTVSLCLAPALALADDALCAMWADHYAQRLALLAGDVEQILSQTTDPEEQGIIRDSYQMQRDLLIAERDSVLAGLNCSPVPNEEQQLPPDDNTGGNGGGEETPPVGGGDEETPPADDGDDEEVPPSDDEETPGPGTELPCRDQLDAYADVLRSQGVRQNEFVHKMQAKIRELNCGNYGGWRSHCVRKIHRCKVEHAKKCAVNKKVCKPQPKKCNKR
jgi:hypothetical protein